MPSYQVLKTGFFNGRLYDPEGKRKILYTEKPFPKKGNKEQIPSWLKLMKSENAAQKKNREASETAAKKDAAKKAEDDRQEIADASFMGEGEKSHSVETL